MYVDTRTHEVFALVSSDGMFSIEVEDSEGNLYDIPMRDWEEFFVPKVDVEVNLTYSQMYNTLVDAILTLEKDHPEFQEEHTTGWDMMEILKLMRDMIPMDETEPEHTIGVWE